MSKKRPQATCHPERPHLAKGLCKPCYDFDYGMRNRARMNKKAREWAARNRDRIKNTRRKYRYGLTNEEFDRRFAEQNGVCAVCKERPATDVDHDHATDKVRGLLCGDCNRALGLLRDSAKFMRAAADYVDHHNGEASYDKAIAAWKAKMRYGGWIGVDLDGTLAHFTSWAGPYHIGDPIPKMATRVRAMLAAKVDVRIFTARASDGDPKVVQAIQDWCQKHFGVVLPVTNVKDYEMVQVFDDRAVQVVPNTGERYDGEE